MGLYINDVTHLLRGRGIFIILFSKMGDKGEGRVKNPKKWVISFMGGPFSRSQKMILSPLLPGDDDGLWNNNNGT